MRYKKGYKILGIIPARRDSKKISNKNIRLFSGKPLIYFSIKEAKKSKYLNRIITTTENPEIRKIAVQFGSEAPFLRPEELSRDFVTDYPVFKHCLDWLYQNENYIPDIVVHLRPTAPLRQVAHIDKAIELLLQSPDVDSIRSVCNISNHPNKAWRIENDLLKPFILEEISGIYESYNQPRQKLPKAYIQNGSVDVIWVKTIIEKKSMSGDRIKPFVMEKLDSVNIDEEIDFLFAEHIYRLRKVNPPRETGE